MFLAICLSGHCAAQPGKARKQARPTACKRAPQARKTSPQNSLLHQLTGASLPMKLVPPKIGMKRSPSVAASPCRHRPLTTKAARGLLLPRGPTSTAPLTPTRESPGLPIDPYPSSTASPTRSVPSSGSAIRSRTRKSPYRPRRWSLRTGPPKPSRASFPGAFRFIPPSGSVVLRSVARQRYSPRKSTVG